MKLYRIYNPPTVEEVVGDDISTHHGALIIYKHEASDNMFNPIREHVKVIFAPGTWDRVEAFEPVEPSTESD